MKADRIYRKPHLPENAKLVFEGNIFDVYQWEQTLYDGSTTTFEKLSRQDTACVFPVLEDGSILLVEDAQPHRESFLQFPSGRVEQGEMPEETARRELLEETGYAPEKLELLYTSTPADKLDWVFYVYIGRGCKKVEEPKPDPGEKIIPKIVSFDDMLALAAEDKVRDKIFTTMVLQAKLDPAKMEELKKKFFG